MIDDAYAGWRHMPLVWKKAWMGQASSCMEVVHVILKEPPVPQVWRWWLSVVELLTNLSCLYYKKSLRDYSTFGYCHLLRSLIYFSLISFHEQRSTTMAIVSIIDNISQTLQSEQSSIRLFIEWFKKKHLTQLIITFWSVNFPNVR